MSHLESIFLALLESQAHHRAQLPQHQPRQSNPPMTLSAQTAGNLTHVNTPKLEFIKKVQASKWHNLHTFMNVVNSFFCFS